MRQNIYATHCKRGEWAVKGERDDRASGLYGTQRKAINTGREIERNNRFDLVIHDRENSILDSDSYGNDPCPPKARRQ